MPEHPDAIACACSHGQPKDSCPHQLVQCSGPCEHPEHDYGLNPSTGGFGEHPDAQSEQRWEPVIRNHGTIVKKGGIFYDITEVVEILNELQGVADARLASADAAQEGDAGCPHTKLVMIRDSKLEDRAICSQCRLTPYEIELKAALRTAEQRAEEAERHFLTTYEDYGNEHARAEAAEAKVTALEAALRRIAFLLKKPRMNSYDVLMEKVIEQAALSPAEQPETGGQ